MVSKAFVFLAAVACIGTCLSLPLANYETQPGDSYFECGLNSQSDRVKRCYKSLTQNGEQIVQPRYQEEDDGQYHEEDQDQHQEQQQAQFHQLTHEQSEDETIISQRIGIPTKKPAKRPPSNQKQHIKIQSQQQTQKNQQQNQSQTQHIHIQIEVIPARKLKTSD